MIKKFKIFLAPNVNKEEQWLTNLSEEGFHFVKYRFGFYYFEQDVQKSYIYQIDFRDSNEAYLQLLKDSGWQHMNGVFNIFQYFRKDKTAPGIKKIYSDQESVKESFQRMMKFYFLLFGMIIVLNIGLFLTWQGFLLQKIAASFGITVFLLYIYIFFLLKKKIDYFLK